jgi:ligand-binding sensor domain-containing protein/serine phosphatase RsbU (regulator of sigma subunit)
MPISFKLFKTFICACALTFTVVQSQAQSYDFKVFDTNVGLPQNFVYCLAQGSDGYLWIGTGEGLVKYDGLNFHNFNTSDSLSSDFIRDIYISKNNSVWIGHDNGSMSVSIDNEFHKISNNATTSPIRDICETEDGNTWAVEQNHGLIRIDKSFKVQTYFDRKKFGRRLYYSIVPLQDKSFLVGTSEGLLQVWFNSSNEVDKVVEIDGIPQVGINVITPRKNNKNEYWIGTEDKGFFLYQQESNSTKYFTNNSLCLSFNIATENVADIIEEDEGNLLIATWGNGVIKLLFDPATGLFKESMNFSQANGLNNNYIKDILHDREGNYWFATYGGGVSVLIADYFIYYELENIGFKNNKVNSVIHFNKELWMGLDNGMLKTDRYCFSNHEFYDQLFGIPNDVITGYYVDTEGTLWASTSQKGLYKRKKGSLRFERFSFSSDLLSNQINDIEGYDNHLYLATMGGLYIIDMKDKSKIQLTTEKNLPHNNINFIYRDSKNQIWIGPKSSGICKIDIKNLNIEVHRLDQTPVDVSGIAEDFNGNLWLATRGKGVLKYTEDTLISINVQSGLSKNFCHSIACDTQNRLWVCHHPGLSCIDLNTMQIRTFNQDNRMGGDFQQVWKDNDNTLWFASSDGVLQYFPDRDKPNQIAPTINLTNIEINKKKYSNSAPIELPYLYGSSYTYRFDFIGISFKNPKGVTYKYKLEEEGEEASGEWIDLGTTSFKDYEFLPDGNYIFKVMAYNADGIASPTPLQIVLHIHSPIWKKIWFYFIIIALIGYSIYRLIKYRERKLVEQKLFLQNEVASQTILLRKQKAEIERKNRDITDSINYAKKIQASILPPLSQLKSAFHDSFIYFAPRDIVSGDFYWFYQAKDYFTVSIADCTGHGVPGAFMSMIGSTLLNDIIKAQPGISPSTILENLDREIKILLQKNSVDQTQDGMDISILEIHIPTRKVRLASAKRPVFLYINNELTIYKGTRRSIGELTTDDTRFINIEYQLSKGDLIYMFSDGYTDQFGGPLGKKFMKVGVENLLEQIRHKNMEEQYATIVSNFTNWKGELDQVDDVIFLGIKL